MRHSPELPHPVDSDKAITGLGLVSTSLMKVLSPTAVPSPTSTPCLQRIQNGLDSSQLTMLGVSACITSSSLLDLAITDSVFPVRMLCGIYHILNHLLSYILLFICFNLYKKQLVLVQLDLK